MKKYGYDYERNNEKDNFNNYHYKYSFELIFGEKRLKEIKENNLVREKIKTYGIILDFDEKLNPLFLHLSYAEYFIARSICLNQLKDNYKYEIERIFTEEKYKLIRIFVNDILLRFSCIENLFTDGWMAW